MLFHLALLLTMSVVLEKFAFDFNVYFHLKNYFLGLFCFCINAWSWAKTKVTRALLLVEISSLARESSLIGLNFAAITYVATEADTSKPATAL